MAFPDVVVAPGSDYLHAEIEASLTDNTVILLVYPSIMTTPTLSPGGHTHYTPVTLKNTYSRIPLLAPILFSAVVGLCCNYLVFNQFVVSLVNFVMFDRDVRT